MRMAVVSAVCCSMAGLAIAADARASIRMPTDIPAEPLDLALKALAKERGLQFVYRSDVVGAARTRGVRGDLTTPEALTKLLEGTRLEYAYLDDNTITVLHRIDTRPGAAPSTDGTPARIEETSDGGRGAGSVWDRLQFAQLDQSAGSGGGGSLSSDGKSSGTTPLQEVLVTAQKKTERQQDVPVAISVVDTQALAQNGQNRLIDYFSTVPGLTIGNSFGGGTQYVTIRGLSTGTVQNPSVATVIDDVPTGSSSVLAFGNITGADLDPSDLDRIEVLKGPQGTLYGADSLGGVIKYVTTDPSTTAFSGRVEVDGADILDGGLGGGMRAAVNIPVSDQFAIRVSGYGRRDPGYVDDLTTGQNNVNSANVYGGHLAALWRPSDDVSLKVSAILQKTDGNGTGYVNSNPLAQFPQGDLKQTGLPGAGRYTTENQLYTATLKFKIAGLDVASVTGYGINKLDDFLDATTLLGYFANIDYGVPGSLWEDRFETDKFTQELRVSSSVGHWLDWLAGAFYTHENSPNSFQDFVATTLAGTVVGDQLYGAYQPLTLSEHAIFGDVTVHVTDRFDVQLGGRESWNEQNYGQTDYGPTTKDLYGVSPEVVAPRTHITGSAFTYLATPEFKISPDLMVYARFASGYRVGGPNVVVVPGIPASYKPDTTSNYELGIKGDLFEHRLTFDAAAYYIEWKNFQIQESFFSDDLSHSYEGNAGSAKSEGLEASVQSHPLEGLTITAQGSYNNAVLTQALQPPQFSAVALSGDRLPYSIRWSGGLTANQDIPLSGEWISFVGGAVNYVSSRLGEFASVTAPFRVAFPAYASVNLSAGVRHDSWLLNLYVNNVGDRRGVVGAYNANAIGLTPEPGGGGYYATVIQPRTLGLSVVKTF